MRYIIDDRGYVKYCSNNYITCENKTCTPYEGDIPDGYETIEEWVQNANIRAYKIVDGNLVLDEEEDARLQEEYDELAKTYSTVEKRIGTWIDGNPLYRKVISINTDFYQKLEFSHGIEGYDKIWIDISNSYYFADGVCVPLVSTSYYEDFAQKNNAMIHKDNVILYSTGGWNTAWTKVITINYTKKSLNIKWNGDTTGREVIENFLDNEGMNLYKVSDLVPTEEELMGGTYKLSLEYSEYPEDNYEDIVMINDIYPLTDDGNVYMGGDFIPAFVVIKQSNEEFPQSQGVYFFNMEEDGTKMYVSSLYKKGE